jgi:phage gp29-like protein
MATATTNGKADGKRIVRHSMVYDSYPRYVTDSPSPEKFAALLKNVDSGELSDLCLLQQEMERKSDQFHGLVRTRRTAVTALEWTIDPDQNADEDDPFAKEVTDYCADKLASIPTWPAALAHLSEAIGPNLAVLELIWDKAELIEFGIVPCTRLASHPITNTGVVIRIDEEPMGVPVELFPGKFVVYVPYAKGGFPFRNTLTHASVMAYLTIHFGRSDWLAFSELYGTPIRVGTYEDAIVDDDRTTLKAFLDEMGSDAAGMLPKGVAVEFMQAQGTGETYPKLLDYADTKLAILWLGQTLTTDIGAVGSFAAAKIHDNVRGSILASDLQAEAYCVREQVLRPMVELKYPGKNAPIPCFHRKTSVRRDIELERLVLEQLAFAAKEGLTVNSDWLYDSLAIPRPESGDLPDTVKLGASAKAETPQLTSDTAPDNNSGGDGEQERDDA